MARRPTRPEGPPEPISLRIDRAKAASLLEARVQAGKQLLQRQISSYQDYEILNSDDNKWSSYNEDLIRKIFFGEQLVMEYRSSGWGSMVINPSLQQRIKSLVQGTEKQISKLESIIERLELFDAPVVESMSERKLSAESSNRVFIVHGRNEAVKHEVARFIEKIGLDAVVLSEQANEGRTIIEKIESNSDVSFAIILLTADDVGALRTDSDNVRSRPRQNVILEMGYFIGLLGRKFVCPIYESDVELPSDVLGVGYLPFDPSGAWRLLLVRELKAVGINVDANKAL